MYRFADKVNCKSFDRFARSVEAMSESCVNYARMNAGIHVQDKEIANCFSR